MDWATGPKSNFKSSRWEWKSRCFAKSDFGGRASELHAHKTNQHADELISLDSPSVVRDEAERDEQTNRDW